MTRASAWPRGLVGQVTLVLLGAMLLEFVASTTLYEQAEVGAADAERTERLAERLSVAGRVLALAPPGERASVARALSTDEIRIAWTERPAPDAGSADPAPEGVRERLLAAEPELAGRDLRLADGRGVWELAGTLRLHDGSVLRFAAEEAPGEHFPLRARVLAGSVLAGSVLLAAAMLVHALGTPLRLLARAADRIGHGPAVAVAEDGPGEVRRLARAFNAMQARIAALVADRTTALAAVSHDLRTPIARCRLRAGFLGDDEAREAIEEDLDEMEAMIDSVLDYLRGETDPEQPRPVDLAALLRTLVDALADAGRPARYEGVDQVVVAVRPLAMKRAFANLVGNALAYGGAACVGLERADGWVRAWVDDDGPGIPEADLERVVQPFERLDASRGRGTGGVGLGLAIARRAVEREGGRLTLSNRPGGGLRAGVMLPDRPGAGRGGRDAGP